MAGQNKVTLTIAGDASGLEKAAAQSSRAMAGTAQSANHLEQQLEETGKAAKGTKELLRGAGDAAAVFGGQMGQSAIQAGYAVSAVRELARGAAALIPKMKEMGTASLLLRGGIIGLAVGGFAELINKLEPQPTMMGKVKGALADMGYAAANNLNLIGQHVPILGSFTGKLLSTADAASQAARSLHFFTDAEQKALDAAKESALFRPADTNPGGDAIFTTADAQGTASQVYESQTPGYKERTLAESGLFDTKKSIGGGVRSAANDAAQAAKEAAQKLADAKKTVEQAVLGLAKAFTPQLSLDPASGGFSRLGTTQGGSGGGLIGNLRKQAKDTLRLRQDLEKLAKMGLDKGLLTQLVDGGLASLPAAEDLLQGGRAEVSQANYYAGKINTRANTIAAEQTARNLTKKDRQQLDINVKGGSAELVALLRKWVAGNGGNVQGVLGS